MNHMTTNFSLPKFSDAVEDFRGYKSFSNIPPEIFARISEIVMAQEINVNHARDRISQVLMEDLVLKPERDLTHEDRVETFNDLRREVEDKLKWHMNERPETSSGGLRLVHSAQ